MYRSWVQVIKAGDSAYEQSRFWHSVLEQKSRVQRIKQVAFPTPNLDLVLITCTNLKVIPAHFGTIMLFSNTDSRRLIKGSRRLDRGIESRDSVDKECRFLSCSAGMGKGRMQRSKQVATTITYKLLRLLCFL